MLVKLYEILWAVIVLVAGLFYVTGNLTEMTAIIFGFICFGMIFMGMISVLPFSVSHQSHGKH